MSERAPISVVIPTLDAAKRLPAALAPLADGALNSLIREVVISDGGSKDDVEALADAAGAVFLRGEKGRGGQLARGAEAARGRWLLFLHADTILGEGWENDVKKLISLGEDTAGVFTLRFDEAGFAPSVVAAGAMLRTKIFAAPYGDQGLLVSRALYDKIGGYRNMPIFEDVEFIDRLIRINGRSALHIMKACALTSADRYKNDGYARRVLKNAHCILMYRMGAAPEKILAAYK